MGKEFSFFNRPIANTTPQKNVTLSEVYELTKGNKYKFETQRIRVTSDTKKQKELKSNSLDYATFSGVFEKRSNDALVKHSGLIVFDFDHLDDVAGIRQILLQDSNLETALLFRSPSYKGVKWVVPIDLDVATHLEWFEAITNYVKKTYGLEIDSSGKDVARACFLCHDPDAYINPKYSADYVEGSDLEAKSFNPHDWLESEQLKLEDKLFKNAKEVSTTPSHQLLEDIEKVVQEIELNNLDLTTTYSNWRDIGFGLADSIGEVGRVYYHRVSEHYPGYDKEECDKQYNNCMNSKGSGITIATLFYHAQQAGVVLSSNEGSNIPALLTSIPKDVYNGLPAFFQQIVNVAKNDTERDILLLGSLATISAVLPNIKGVYDGKYVYASLYFFLEGMPGSGKAKLDHCRKLVKPIQDHYNNLYKKEHKKYQTKMALYREQRKDDPSLVPPEEPKQVLIILPANISAAGLYELLSNNKGSGLIFETEGDTLAEAFRNKDFGNFSDAFRKAFHHETISSYRKSLQELFEIQEPRLSVVLSGTPQQVVNLIPNAENGLFSRFMYYSVPMTTVWKNVFENSIGTTLEDYFLELGITLFEFYKEQQESDSIQFRLTAKQQMELNKRFELLQRQNATLLGNHFISVIRRMGLIVFRIAMIFTAIRNMGSIKESELVLCNDNDFNNAMSVGEVLLEHSKYAFRGLKELPGIKRRDNNKEKFLNALPEEFDRQTYLEIAESTGINPKTAERYITKFCKSHLIHRTMYNNYNKAL